MQIFRLYFKLLKKTLPTLMIYVVIFLLITIGLTLLRKDGEEGVFEESKVDIAYINHDKDSTLLKGFKEYLSNSCNFVELEDTKEAVQDALFFREVVYIITIPEGFTDNILSGKVVHIQKSSVPDSEDAAYVDIAINSYFNTAKMYLNNIEDISETELIQSIAKDLKIETQVSVYSKDKKENYNSQLVYYFNYLVYPLLSILIPGIGAVMMSFSNVDIRRRSSITPIPTAKINMQQIFGNLTFTLGCVSLFIITAFIMHQNVTLDKVNILFILNAFIFSIVALSIAYLVCILVKSKDATSGIANIIGLGSCFISGVFVPREFLGEIVINIAKFTPAYWYTSANVAIGELTNYTSSNLTNIYIYMLIQLGFAVALFAISLVASKKKSMNIV